MSPRSSLLSLDVSLTILATQSTTSPVSSPTDEYHQDANDNHAITSKTIGLMFVGMALFAFAITAFRYVSRPSTRSHSSSIVNYIRRGHGRNLPTALYSDREMAVRNSSSTLGPYTLRYSPSLRNAPSALASDPPPAYNYMNRSCVLYQSPSSEGGTPLVSYLDHLSVDECVHKSISNGTGIPMDHARTLSMPKVPARVAIPAHVRAVPVSEA